MDTPLYDFIKSYSESNAVRLHMPGHKGKDSGLCESFDITEIEGADLLYHETGVLKKSQENAAALFAAKKTVYSTEGSSLCIRAMLALIKTEAEKTGKRPLIAAGRNAHKVFMTASALLGIDVKWIYPETENSVVSAEISPGYLRDFLKNCEKLPDAVYITSPDYLGNIADIKGLSEVCRENGVLLAVDNAHGAYLNFLPKNMHPIHLGAHICCDSAHKTLPALTGGAYIHISEDAPSSFFENAGKAMSLFASTSPSYLILVSLDRLNGYLSENYRQELSVFTAKLDKLKRNLSDAGFVLMGNEPLKLTLSVKTYGYTGYEIADILRKKSIECEFCDPDFVVLMFTPSITEQELKYTENVLLSIPKRMSLPVKFPTAAKLRSVMSAKDAMFRPFVTVNSEDAVGRILAAPSVTCPPAVPIAICGEELTEDAINSFKYYGISKIDVIE